MGNYNNSIQDMREAKQVLKCEMPKIGRPPAIGQCKIDVDVNFLYSVVGVNILKRNMVELELYTQVLNMQDWTGSRIYRLTDKYIIENLPDISDIRYSKNFEIYVHSWVVQTH